MGPRKFVLVALCALIVVAGGCALVRTNSPEPATSAVGVRTCPLAALPPEVADTVRAIHSNGPFPFPRNDGVLFGNREGHLPNQVKGYYHEYTVPTPGLNHRGARRIVTGGNPPEIWYYSADHYRSFRQVEP